MSRDSLAGGVGQAGADDLGSDCYHEQVDDDANGPTQNPSHPQSVGSEASTRIAELEAAIGQISRMKLFPDDKINRTTLQAAIHIARSLSGEG